MRISEVNIMIQRVQNFVEKKCIIKLKEEKNVFIFLEFRYRNGGKYMLFQKDLKFLCFYGCKRFRLGLIQSLKILNVVKGQGKSSGRKCN